MHNIEIKAILKGNINLYSSIGQIIDNPDGYFDLWPEIENSNLISWKTKLLEQDTISKTYLIGSLLNETSNDILPFYMLNFLEKNKVIIELFCKKYFDDFHTGLIVKQGYIFLDLIYGSYSNYDRSFKIDASSDAEEEYNYNYKRFYSDGMILEILNKSTTWDEMTDNVFVKSEFIKEFSHDIKMVVDLF